MSRLLEYMKLSTSDEMARFRSVSFKLVKENTTHGQLLESLDKEHSDEITQLHQELNAELKKIYNGNYRFDFCIDEGDGVNILKIKRKQSKALGIICHRCNDKLTKIKRIIETKMSNNKDI